MIKLLFDSTIFLHQKNGGISRYISNLNDNLKKYNINSYIFSPITINDYLDKKKENVKYYFKINKIPKYCTTLFYLINNFLTFFHILLNKPDMIHFSYYNNSRILRLLKIPCILTVHDLTHEEQKSIQTRFDKKQNINDCSHIICISKKTKKNLKKFYDIDEKKIHIIYHGLRSKKFSRNINLKNKKKFILFIGQRNGYKNFKNFVIAFSKSKFLIENYKIVCFGGNSFSSNEKKLFRNLKILSNINHFSGNDKKIFNYYKKASLFINPSLKEGFGLTNLEAMSFGCPVICSDIDIFKEILGESSLYFDPSNTKKIMYKLEKVLKSKSLRKIMIKKGYKRLDYFNINKCLFKTSIVYKKAINSI